MSVYIYKISLLVAILTLMLCLIGGISFYTSILRASIVFIGMLFIFYLAGQMLNMGFLVTGQKENRDDTK